MLRRHVLAFAAGGLALGLGFRTSSVRAQATRLAGEAQAFVRDLALQAIDSLTTPGMSDAQRREEFRALLNAAFDVPLLAEFALGRYWRGATDEQRAEYMLLYEESLVIANADRFRGHTGETLRVLQARTTQDDEAVVNSELPRPDAPPIRVGWRVRREGASFKIIDVFIEGVSMAITQRDDYAATIQRGGGRVAALLAAMREKNTPPPPRAAEPTPTPNSPGIGGD
jgi:phospholipid transport system substrate-binding protein